MAWPGLSLKRAARGVRGRPPEQVRALKGEQHLLHVQGDRW